MTKIKRVKQEYNEPFKDVVKSYATMGYSRRAVASILEIKFTTFLRYVRRFNLGDNFRPTSEMRRDCRSWGMTK